MIRQKIVKNRRKTNKTTFVITIPLAHKKPLQKTLRWVDKENWGFPIPLSG